MSSWTRSFKYADYGERAKFLLSYLRMRPEPFDKKDPLSKGYKSVLAFIVASLCVRDEFRYISEGAKAQLKGISNPNYNYMYNKKAHPEYKELTSEHTIPVSVIVDYLLDPNNDGWTEESLADFLEKVSGIAVVTKGDNELLNKAGLRSKLPNGTTLADIVNGKAEHTIRYDEVKIELAKDE